MGKFIKALKPNPTNNNKEEISQYEDESKVGLVENIKNAPPIQNIHGETLMLFESARYKGKTYRHFFGIGKVFRVVKGDHQDLVYIRFGALETFRPRLVIVYDNHARRQVLMLKRGNYVELFGLCRVFTKHYVDKTTGEQKKTTKMGLYAIGFNAWYLPTMMDVRKLPTNEDIETPTDYEENKMNELEDVLNEFLTGKGDIEDE